MIGTITLLAVLLFFTLRGGPDPNKPFVAKLENFLAQSRDGREQVIAVVAAARSCRLTPVRALAKLDLVDRNRQSLLDQLAALTVPADRDARRATDLLQKAIGASKAADLAYRDWLTSAQRCPLPTPPTNAADRRAQQAKDAFVAVFNPLARRYGGSEWDPHRF
jgi:hypothetical protein